MMEYEVEVDGQKFQVRFFQSDGDLFVEHAGGTFPVKAATPLRDRVQVAQFNGTPQRFGYHRGKESTDIILDGVTYSANVRELEHARLAAVSGRKAAGGRMEIKSPMPGIVVTVRVQVGETVRKNQSLLSLHAMKLENDIRSPRDGVVEAILVKANDVLEKGVVMVKLGPLPAF
jgi:biotin carboxyl carrier protein